MLKTDMIIMLICSIISECSAHHGTRFPLDNKVYTKVTPQMFGAKADGKHDDTYAIRKACSVNTDTIFFPKGTYIINIAKGENNVPNNFFSPRANVIMGEGGSVIKLGKGNGNAADGHGFESIFSFGGTNRQITIKNLTFDFNYKDNPIHQYTSNDVGVEINGQQMAINAYRVSGLTVDSCIFIDHSGTNCVIYRGNYESDTLYCNVTNCHFLSVGHKSYYQGKDAYHDCSTIGIHSDRKKQKSKLIVHVENNILEGAGGNAFDACECAADEFFFRNNWIKDYVIGVMPLTCNSGTKARIERNVFKRVARGIGFWSCWMDVEDLADNEGFELIQIENNEINIDIPFHLSRASYRTINNKKDSYYLGGTYSAICAMGNWNKSLGTLSISDNCIKYADTKKVDSKYICNRNLYNGSVVGLFNLYNTTPKFARCREVIFCNNIVNNAPSCILRLTPFNRIDKISFCGNKLKKCWRNAPVSVINEGIISIHPSKYKKNAVSWGDFLIKENSVDMTDINSSFAVSFLKSTIKTNLNKNSSLTLENNRVRGSYRHIQLNEGVMKVINHE